MPYNIINTISISSSQLESFANPESITRIFINPPYNVEDLKHLAKFTNLINLTIYDIDNLDLSNVELPQSLKRIDLSYCKNLKKFPDYFFSNLINLKELDLSSSGIEDLSNVELPSSLEKIDLSDCKNLKKFPNDFFSNLINLKELDLCNSIIEDLSNVKLPESLEKIHLSWCKNLKKFPDYFFSNLINRKELDLSSSGIEDLSNVELPSSLEKIDLSDCKNLKKFPNDFFSNLINLKELDLGESGIEDLSNVKLPSSLEKIDLYNCENLKELPNDFFSNLINLKELRLAFTNIKDLSNVELPQTLKIDLYNCKNLEKLPDLSNCTNLNSIDLTGCDSLPNNAETIKQLLDLEDKNAHNPQFSLKWPAHINRGAIVTEIKDSIKNSYQKYWQEEERLLIEPKEEDKANCPTLCLLHRFLTENLNHRGNRKTIFDQAKKIADQIVKNPNLLETIDETARGYLDACINQPVAGFIEIANIIEVAKCDTFEQKLQKAKNILIVNKIRDDVIKLAKEQSVGNAVEVEFYNAMIAIVNERLTKEKVIEPLVGIPEKIAYESTISSKLTKDNINKIFNDAKSYIAELTIEKTADILCEGHFKEFWANQILDPEYIKSHKDQIKCLKKLYLDSLLTDNDYQNKETELKSEILQHSREETFNNVKSCKEYNKLLIKKNSTQITCPKGDVDTVCMEVEDEIGEEPSRQPGNTNIFIQFFTKISNFINSYTQDCR